MIKILVGYIGKIAGVLIKHKKSADKPTPEEQLNKKILESKLLSGGLENRFLKIFSKQSRNQIQEVIELVGDKKIN